MDSSLSSKEASSVIPSKDASKDKSDSGRSDAEKQTLEPAIESKKSVYGGLGWLDRLLVLWIFLAIVIGILLGNFVDSIGPALQKGKFVGVSVPIGMCGIAPRDISVFRTLTISSAVGLLVMMYPILCKIKYEALHSVFAHRQIWIQLAFSVVANWIIAPLLMVSQPIVYIARMNANEKSLVWLGRSCPMSQVYGMASSLLAWHDALPW